MSSYDNSISNNKDRFSSSNNSILKFSTINVNSLSNKLHFINNYASCNGVHVLSITETWLIDADVTSFVDLPEFSFFRGCFEGEVRKHGVGLYVSKGLRCLQVEVPVANVVMVCLLDFDLFVLSVYRPPSYSQNENSLLISFLSDHLVGKEVVVMGDFNLPTLKWPLESMAGNYVCPVDREFRDCFIQNGWTQWVEFSTFPSGNTLDLVFTSEGDRVMDIVACPPLPGCHHVPVLFGYVFQWEPEADEEVGVEKLDWFRADYVGILEGLYEVDWQFVFSGVDADGCYGILLDVLSDLVTQFVPRRAKHKGGKWLIKPPRALLRERAALWTAYKESRRLLGRNHHETLTNLATFNSSNHQYRSYAWSRQCQYERKLVSLLGVAPKVFHSYLRERKKGCPTIGPLKEEDGSLVVCTGRMSQLFVDSFASVFVSDVPASPHVHQLSETRMENITVGYSDVFELLKNLDGSSSAGPDGVHPMLLKSCSEVIALPLSIIFQKSIESAVLPREWKISGVAPIFKGGSKANALNYRPVSLTSVPCKVLERVIDRQLRDYLDMHGLLVNQQFGFRKGRSTEDQLLLTYSEIIAEVDRGNVVDVLFLDISKAFDQVSHELILEKLTSLGVGEQLIRWIEQFLCGRQMFVTVGGQSSSPVEVRSGVPQGSVLGPLLFLVYVNYVAHDINCPWFAFADDFKLYLAQPREHGGGRMHQLQDALDTVCERSRSWNLKLNPNKCVAMRFGTGSQEVNTGAVGCYTLQNVELRWVNVHRDLGIMVDSKLKFHFHINTVVRKASAVANQILRGTVCRSPDFMVPLFVSHVRPLLDYCSTVWNLGYLGDTRKLEAIQRRWTREVDGMEGLEYEERLKNLGLFSIYGRYLRADLIKVWKSFNSVEDVGLSGMFERSNSQVTRGHSFKLNIPICNGEVRRRFLNARCVNIWNRLPREAVESVTVEAFKRQLDVFLLDKFFETIGGR